MDDQKGHTATQIARTQEGKATPTQPIQSHITSSITLATPVTPKDPRSMRKKKKREKKKNERKEKREKIKGIRKSKIKNER